MTAPPAAEALTLSATLFHADIDSWLPANFGVTRPEKDKAAEWESALRGAQRDRLGLGHPDLEDAGARARAASGRAGIEALRRMQKKRKDGDGDGEEGGGRVGGGKGGRDEDEEEDESRTRAVSKKKKSTVDVFGKKSKNANANAVHPLLRLVNPIPGYDPASAGEVDGKSDEAKDMNAEAMSETKPAESKTDSAAGTKRPRDDDDDDADADEAEAEAEVDTAGMSKTQARREKRKRAKARKAAA